MYVVYRDSMYHLLMVQSNMDRQRKVSKPARGQLNGEVKCHCTCIRGKYIYMYVCLYGHTYSKIMDQPSKVAGPAHGQLNRKNVFFPIRVRA